MNLRTKKDLEGAGYITRTRKQNTILGDPEYVLEAKVFIAFPGYGTIPYTVPAMETMPEGHQIRWLPITKKGFEHIDSDVMYRQIKEEAEA